MNRFDKENIERTLEQIAGRIYAAKGLKNSDIAKNTDVDINVSNLIRLTVQTPDYAVFVDSGRKPGRIPPIRDIQTWIKRKRITIPSGYTEESLAYAIANVIAKEGTKGKDFIRAMREELKRTARLMVVDSVRKETTRRLRNNIKTQLKR